MILLSKVWRIVGLPIDQSIIATIDNIASDNYPKLYYMYIRVVTRHMINDAIYKSLKLIATPM